MSVCFWLSTSLFLFPPLYDRLVALQASKSSSISSSSMLSREKKRSGRWNFNSARKKNQKRRLSSSHGRVSSSHQEIHVLHYTLMRHAKTKLPEKKKNHPGIPICAPLTTPAAKGLCPRAPVCPSVLRPTTDHRHALVNENVKQRASERATAQASETGGTAKGLGKKRGKGARPCCAIGPHVRAPHRASCRACALSFPFFASGWLPCGAGAGARRRLANGHRILFLLPYLASKGSD